MNFKLIATLEDHGKAGWVGCIDSIKGLVVQGKTMDETCNELMTSLKVKIAYDLGIPASELKEATKSEILKMKRKHELWGDKKEICKKEISLTLS